MAQTDGGANTSGHARLVVASGTQFQAAIYSIGAGLLKEATMSAKAGEKARETGDFRCEHCHQQTHVSKGQTIPKCPHCCNDTFDTRYHEPGNKS